MIKYFCDKCSKELDTCNEVSGFISDVFKVRIEPPDIRRWTDDAETGNYVLCYDCVKEFNKWIRTSPLAKTTNTR